MAIPTPKVEIGFDLTDSPIGPFFRLNDDVAGRLDNTDFRLGGTIFYDVTDRVRSLSISRGKGRRFTDFPAGQAVVEFNNHDRAFDPEYSASPFAGNIIPRREIKVSAGTAIQFTGWVDDWNLTYTPDGNSIADAAALDATTILAKQTLTAGTPTQELTSTRVNTALTDAGWASDLRDIQTGTVEVGTQEIEANQNALSYLEQVTRTEAGLLFVDKLGRVAFRPRRQAPSSASLVTFDQSSGIPYQAIGITYGSELLYNKVTIANIGGGTATASSVSSQNEYGVREYSQTDLLGATDAQSIDLAVYYADLYSEPEYRIDALEIATEDLTAGQQEDVLGLEIGDVCQVSFTPNNIGDPIVKYVQVIKVDHAVTTSFHKTTLGFQEIKYLLLVLDDAVFGKLDEAYLG